MNLFIMEVLVFKLIRLTLLAHISLSRFKKSDGLRKEKPTELPSSPEHKSLNAFTQGKSVHYWKNKKKQVTPGRNRKTHSSVPQVILYPNRTFGQTCHWRYDRIDKMKLSVFMTKVNDK